MLNLLQKIFPPRKGLFNLPKISSFVVPFSRTMHGKRRFQCGFLLFAIEEIPFHFTRIAKGIVHYLRTYLQGGRAVPDASADPGGLAEREESFRPPRPLPVVLAVAAVLAAGDGAVPAVPVAGLAPRRPRHRPQAQAVGGRHPVLPPTPGKYVLASIFMTPHMI